MFNAFQQKSLTDTDTGKKTNLCSGREVNKPWLILRKEGEKQDFSKAAAAKLIQCALESC